MAITVVNEALPQVGTSVAFRVETKALWANDWEYRPEIEVVRCSLTTGAGGMSDCVIKRRYGQTKFPYDVAGDAFTTTYPEVEPLDILGHWVAVYAIEAEGDVLLWCGKISSEDSELYGSEISDVPSGVQQWTAYGPLHHLNKIRLSESYYSVETATDTYTEMLIDDVPDVNARDNENRITGNRSDAVSDGTVGDSEVYLYGESSTWTNKQYLEYVLQAWVNLTDMPVFSLGGQTDILADLTDHIPLKIGISVGEILRKMIPLKSGVDFLFEPTEDGFEIRVFALNAIEHSFQDEGLPKNPNTLRIEETKPVDEISTVVERTKDWQFSRIRIVGEPIVVTTTLGYQWGSLDKAWDADEEAAYLEGFLLWTDDSDAKVHDAYRKHDRFRPVFQAFTVPEFWDFDYGTAAPTVNSNGEIEDETAGYQYTQRKTLSWLPFREGVDYTTYPATDNNPGGYVPGYLPVIAWLYDPRRGTYITSESVGIGVSVSRSSLAFMLNGRPNHRLALNHWTSAKASAFDPNVEGDEVVAFDWQDIAVTVAWRSDQRLKLEYEIPNNETSDGSVLTIYEPNAELWYVAPGTYVGVTDNGELQAFGEAGPTKPTPAERVIRNDTSRLCLRMAGAIARYYAVRSKAKVQTKGIRAWGGLLGHVLTYLQDGDETAEIQSAITSIVWIGGDTPNTTISTGFA